MWLKFPMFIFPTDLCPDLEWTFAPHFMMIKTTNRNIFSGKAWAGEARISTAQTWTTDGTISFLQIFFGKLTNCQTTFCQPSFYPPFILPNFFCANLQFTKYILPNLHFLDFWKTYKFPSFCQTYILPNLHFAKPFSL